MFDRKDKYLSYLELFKGVRSINVSHIHTKAVESLIVIILSMALATLLSNC